MTEIFDLSKVFRLVEKERPVCAILLDTNVVMNYPSPDTWKVTAGPTLFIIPPGVLIELEFLKEKIRKNEQNPRGTIDKSIIAINSLKDLFIKGKISNGIIIPGGWAISIPYPRHDDLEAELNQIKQIRDAFKSSDSTYLLLTKECAERLPTPVIMVTGEINLFNLAQAWGIPLRLISGFPMETPIEVNEATADWGKALQKMNNATKENSIEVQVTLLVKKCESQSWPDGIDSKFIAEGRGIMRDSTQSRPFIWSLPYNEMIFTDSIIDPAPEITRYNTEMNLDFMDCDDFDQETLLPAIAQRLGDFTNPYNETGPILQSSVSIIYSLLLSEYDKDGKGTDDLRRDIESNQGGTLENNLSTWLKDKDSNAKADFFQRFTDRILRLWNVGETHIFRIMIDRGKVEE
jgi:hypothetical protein